MPSESRPEAEVAIDARRIATLLRAQHPDLADRPLRLVAHGWDNVMARLGDDLAVRLPRRALAAALVAHEQRWLPALAARLPLPIPAPVRCGVPGEGYPWAWSVVPWFAGATALATPPRDLDGAARALARFLAALHAPAPADAPANPFRGVPLAARDARVRAHLAILGGDVDRAAITRRWEAACALAAHGGRPCWLHGDLHPGNLIVADGALAAVIDFGDLTAGDPATDLAIAWMMLPAAERERFRRALAVDDATWERAAGNALAHGLACLARSADDPPMARLGRRTIAAVMA